MSLFFRIVMNCRASSRPTASASASTGGSSVAGSAKLAWEARCHEPSCQRKLLSLGASPLAISLPLIVSLTTSDQRTMSTSPFIDAVSSLPSTNDFTFDGFSRYWLLSAAEPSARWIWNESSRKPLRATMSPACRMVTNLVTSSRPVAFTSATTGTASDGSSEEQPDRVTAHTSAASAPTSLTRRIRSPP